MKTKITLNEDHEDVQYFKDTIKTIGESKVAIDLYNEDDGSDGRSVHFQKENRNDDVF